MAFRRWMTSAHLALALILALPADRLIHERFQPIDEHVTLTGGASTHAFHLPRREPLYLEYGLTLRSAGEGRPTAVVSLNGTVVVTLQGDRLFVPIRGKVPMPASAVEVGVNRLHVVLEGPSSASFELHGRVQNYFGIAPDFPRVFVVADDAMAQRTDETPAIWRAIRLVVCYVLSLAAIATLARGLRGQHRTTTWWVLSSPAWLPWAVLVYSVGTPLHIWLSAEAFGVAAFTGYALACAAMWIAHRPAPVFRAVAILVVNVTVLEMALRAFNAVHPSFVFYSDAYTRYRGRPGAPFFDTRLNSLGFNDIEHERTRPPDVAERIVAIGDSFNLGIVPYAANYLTRLEAELSASGGRVEVINMGIAATEPSDYLSVLVNEGLAFLPDVVIVSVFVGNDFEAPGRQWYEHSYLATFVRALWRMRSGPPSTPAAATDGRPARYSDDEPSLSEERFLEIEVDRAWIYRRGEASFLAAAARVAGELREMRDMTRRAGADFWIVLVPDEVQIDDALRGDVLRASGLAAEELDFDQPNRVLAAHLGRDGIRVLDLLPAFRTAGRATRLYKKRDTHWNIAGNRLAAVMIAEALRAPAHDTR